MSFPWKKVLQAGWHGDLHLDLEYMEWTGGGGWLGRFRGVVIRVDWTLASATEQQWAMRAQCLGFLVFTKGLMPALTS